MTYKQEVRKKIDGIPLQTKCKIYDLFYSNFNINAISKMLNIPPNIIQGTIKNYFFISKQPIQEAK